MKRIINYFKKRLADKRDEKQAKKAELEFKAKCDEADRLSRTTGRRYFVVPASETELAIVDNRYIRYYNKQKGVKKINIYDLIKMAYYATSTRPLVNR